MKPIEFGYDIITTCSLEIETEDFEDCDGIRNQVLQLQESLVTGDVVSRGGAIWKTGLNASASGEVVPILRTPFINESELEDGVRCTNIPARHLVDILYTTVPDPGPWGRPIHRIVGVRVRQEAENWTADVSAPVQVFFLFSVVTFIRVPLVDEAPKTRFWELMTAPEMSEWAWLNIFKIVDHFETGDEILEMSACSIVLVMLAVALCVLFRCEL
ncbi:uncharacterized protein [Periplaneta americana]|uniref:uncharacterized protein n=1 Tax=Periplaneta americana TaxID=6978 RepID=UPI0037E99980